jgi:two-component system response regulator RegA
MSVNQAIAEMRRQNFEVAVIDLVMPKKGGMELIMELKATDSSVRFIVMSGQVPVGGESVTRLVERYGAAGALPKPFSATELNDAVNRALI